MTVMFCSNICSAGDFVMCQVEHEATVWTSHSDALNLSHSLLCCALCSDDDDSCIESKLQFAALCTVQ